MSQIETKLKSIVEDNSTMAGKTFDYFIQSLILVSIISFSIETIPDLSGQQRRILRLLEIICVAIFTVEYLLRIYVADSRPGFIFSFFGIIDFLAIAPFYISTGIDLRSLRILRFLRIFRIVKLARYNNAFYRLSQVLKDSREEFVIFFFSTTMLLYIAAVGIYFCENEQQPEAFSSVFESLWWAVATLTTVGYGDVYPITVGGRLFTYFVLMIGLGIVAVPAGIISSSLSHIKNEEDRDKSADEG